ncbi:MAG: class I SAM-dependent methyltransferase [Bacteroidetes bacterium]|nr:class I SAM-dependent methyltransferase [Bacteroidota bacterium]
MKGTKYISRLIRKIRLSAWADKLRYYLEYLKNYSDNNQFQKKHPGFIFPPPYFMYETYAVHYRDYHEDGLQTAKEILNELGLHINFSEPGKSLLDWGCGPARVVRHIPGLLPVQQHVFGCDYNAAYVNWCSKNITGIQFFRNELEPPTIFQPAALDGVYALSIITHLSAINHEKWIAELERILKPGGVLLLTTQGNQFKHKLLPEECEFFENGELVIRASETEGHRVFAAFQPEAYMKKLLAAFTLLKFIPGGTKESIHGMQDTWIVQKKLSATASAG